MHKRIFVFENIGEILTLNGAQLKGGRRINEADLSIINNGVMACADGRIVWIGSQDKFNLKDLQSWGDHKKAQFIDLKGKSVLPGFVECHTHLVFAGNRSHEFEWRMQGQTYQEIAAKGGGILSTVKDTRKASFSDLLNLAQKRTQRFVDQGVTCLEVKSGYGLDLNTEIKCLQVAGALSGPRIVRTYLGAHARSPDYPDLKEYNRVMLNEILPQIAAEKYAERVDIYIEKGFFDLELAREYLQKASQLGLHIVAHSDQLSDFGGTDLALEFSPQSVDHAVYVNDRTIQRLSQSGTVGVLLPASDFYLKMRYPPARAMIEAGVCVAISTDFNPGTSPTQDLSFVGLLARMEMKMTLAEVICAYTFGAAKALGKSQDCGSLDVGKYCDFSVLNGSWQELFYSVGHHPVEAVYRSGERIDVKE